MRRLQLCDMRALTEDVKTQRENTVWWQRQCWNDVVASPRSQRLTATTRSWGKVWLEASQSLWGSIALPIPLFGAFGLQNCERMHFCVLSHPVCGTCHSSPRKWIYLRYKNPYFGLRFQNTMKVFQGDCISTGGRWDYSLSPLVRPPPCTEGSHRIKMSKCGATLLYPSLLTLRKWLQSHPDLQTSPPHAFL